MLKRRLLKFLFLTLITFIFIFSVHGFLTKPVDSSQPLHSTSVVPQSSELDLICKEATVDKSGKQLQRSTFRELYNQVRERYERTRDLNDLNQALNCAKEAYQQPQNLSASLNRLSLLLEVTQWLQNIEKELREENWVSSIKREIASVQDKKIEWATQAKDQINILLQNDEIKKLTMESLSKDSSDVYTRLNYAQSLIRLKSSVSLQEALELAKEPSWEFIDQLLNGGLEIAQGIVEKSKISQDKQALAYALGYIGQRYEKAYKMSQHASGVKQNAKVLQNYLSVAQKQTEKALKIVDSVMSDSLSAEEGEIWQWRNMAYQWQWQLGRIHKLAGENEAALAVYSVAVQTLEGIRKDLRSAESDIQFSFRDKVQPVYREYAGLLLQDGNSLQQKQKNLEKARDLIESLQLAELENFLACNLPISKPADELADEDPEAAIIYPIILSDRLEVIISTPQKGESFSKGKRILDHYAAPNTDQDTVETTLRELRYFLELPFFSSQRGKESSKKVYNWLIRPAEEKGLISPTKNKTLLFVLDGSLRNIPMAVLFDGNQFLIEKYAVAIAPRLQLLVSKPKEPRKALLAALSLAPNVENFGSLQYAIPEVRAIANVLEKNTKPLILIDKDFTTDNLKREIRSSAYNVIHLTTHGQFDFSNEQKTFIVTASLENPQVGLTDFKKLFPTNNPNPIDLLVLSACETASGDDRDTLGIAGMTVRVGARSTIATLWGIDDPATAKLMSKFYTEYIGNKLTKAKALQKAMVSLFRENNFLYPPSRWAPYVLVGDWR